MAPARTPACSVPPVRTDITLQQRQLDQVELGPAAADAFEFTGKRFARVDRTIRDCLSRGPRGDGPR